MVLGKGHKKTHMLIITMESRVIDTARTGALLSELTKFSRVLMRSDFTARCFLHTPHWLPGIMLN